MHKRVQDLQNDYQQLKKSLFYEDRYPISTLEGKLLF